MNKHLEPWILQVATRSVLDSWQAAALVMRDILNAISDAVAPVYGGQLRWSSEDTTYEDWESIDTITEHLIALRSLNDHGQPIEEIGATGGIGGHLLDATGECDRLVSCVWSARTNHRYGFGGPFEFKPSRGVAKPLNEHAPEWLADLVCRTGHHGHAQEVAVHNQGLGDAFWETPIKVIPAGCGVATYVPLGVTVPTDLPPSFTVYPRELGTAIIADLDQALTAPETLVDDLITLSRQLTHLHDQPA
ncbi:hypothetical protein [Microlunatus parietis]|uniref:Immunity protein 52 n=1 Tax=Microlunatus parietis TaxID=682979 RepID=A0A7Y9I659_9ACTN|nr:hypothetical protein [Microlunatus parietis]NYE70989.1 hypothetical protein [Microlunatus parietis]